MEATIKFKLPEESEDHKIAISSGDLYSAMFAIRRHFFNKVDEEEMSIQKAEIYKEVFDFIVDRLDSHEVGHLF